MGFPHFARVASGDGENFTLLEPLVYVTQDGQVLVCALHALTDGPSIPRALQCVACKTGAIWLPAILHDSAYRATLVDECGTQVILSKNECDLLFYEAMLGNGVGEREAAAAYEAVRDFGQSAFDYDRAKLCLTPAQTV